MTNHHVIKNWYCLRWNSYQKDVISFVFQIINKSLYFYIFKLLKELRFYRKAKCNSKSKQKKQHNLRCLLIPFSRLVFVNPVI